ISPHHFFILQNDFNSDKSPLSHSNKINRLVSKIIFFIIHPYRLNITNFFTFSIIIQTNYSRKLAV
ncbi:hypothetical protein, partial [Streptococcus agalactiae]|uniref:hypothetical protein n=1 Tax=Streptococcus agalactiae TaxID=1311 RepID=UPI001F488A99